MLSTDTPPPSSRRATQPATLGQLAAAVTILGVIIGAAVYAGTKIGGFESSEGVKPILIDRRDRETDHFREDVNRQLDSLDRRVGALESRGRP